MLTRNERDIYPNDVTRYYTQTNLIPQGRLLVLVGVPLSPMFVNLKVRPVTRHKAVIPDVTFETIFEDNLSTKKGEITQLKTQINQCKTLTTSVSRFETASIIPQTLLLNVFGSKTFTRVHITCCFGYTFIKTSDHNKCFSVQPSGT